MTEHANISSLAKYYRRPKISVKLPTNGLWYSPDVIDLNENAVVNILPMTGLDEIKSQTPELVADNNFKFDLIRSCCPSIKKPEMLKSVDVTSLLFGIYAASYGLSYKSTAICPHCLAKYNKIESKEAKELAEQNKDVNIKEQTFSIPVEKVLNMSTVATSKNYVIEFDGLKLYLQPVDIKIVNDYSSTVFYQEMLETKIQELTEEANSGKKEKDEVIKTIQDEVKKYSDKIYGIVFEMLVQSIEYIEIQETGEKVYSREEIKEFIRNAPHTIIDKIRDERDKTFEKLGIPSKITVECNCCHGNIEVDTLVFDPTAFFDTAS